MGVLREVIAKFALDVDSSALHEVDEGLGGLLEGAKKFAKGFAAAFAVNEVKEFLVHMTELGDEIDKASIKLGISTDALQQWRYAAGLSGVDAGVLQGSLQFLQRNAFGAANGVKGSAAAFKLLGVHIKGSDGQLRSMEDLLPEMADGFKNIQNPMERSALATKLFGRAGIQLLPLLAEGSDGIAKMKDEFQALGGGASKEFVNQAKEANDQMDRMDLAMFSLKSRIAVSLLPTFLKLLQGVTDFVASSTKLAKQSNVIQAALLVLGAAAIAFGIKFAIGFAGPLLVAGAFAIAIAFIILVVDDLITLFKGGKSVIGGFIDEMFGAGTAAELVAELKEAWEGFNLTITDTWNMFKNLIQTVSEFLNKVSKIPILGQVGGLQLAKKGANALAGLLGPGAAAPAPLSGRASNNLSDIQQRQAAAAAAQGTVVRFPGENQDVAQQRFAQLRAEQAAANTATVPGGRGRGAAAVDARATATINIQGNPDRRSIEHVKRVVDDVMRQRNRQAVAALVQQAPEEGE